MAPRNIFWLDETHETVNGFEVNIVTEDKPGYLPAALIVPSHDARHALSVVATLNELLFGVDANEALNIVTSSMFPKVT